MIVHHYGIHRQDDLIFLHEAGGGVCLTPGLERLTSPFEVVTTRFCPHDYARGGDRAEIPDHPIVHKLGPAADGGAYWVPPEASSVLRYAHQICSPNRPVFFIPWADPIRSLTRDLNCTNAAPLIIVDYALKDVDDIVRLLSIPRVRTIILCSRFRVPGVQELPFTPFDADAIAWPNVGLSLLDAHIRSML